MDFVPIQPMLPVVRPVAQAAMPDPGAFARWREAVMMEALAPTRAARPPTAILPAPAVAVTHASSVEAMLDLLARYAPRAEPPQIEQLLQYQQALSGHSDTFAALLRTVLQQGREIGVTALLRLLDAMRATEADTSAAQRVGRQEEAIVPVPRGAAGAAVTAQHAQWFQQSAAVVLGQAAMPAAVRLAPHEMLQLLTTMLQEFPDRFEHEVFALPVAQQAGLQVPQYQQAAALIDPVRLALLLIAARRAEAQPEHTSLLRPLVDALQAQLADPATFARTIQQWEARVQPTVLQTPDEQQAAIRVWQQQHPQQADIVRSLQAVSRQQGVLPATAWSVRETGVPLQVLEWQGGAWLAAHAQPHRRRAPRLLVQDEAGHAAWMGLLAYWWGGAEAGDEETPPPSPLPALPLGYAQYQQSMADPLRGTCCGAIDVSLTTPIIFTQLYRDQPIPAPLQLSFHFLADLVAPETRYSRTEFLRLAQSPTSSQFRASIRALAERGAAAYSDYVDALDALFAALPVRGETFQRARQFLRDEVLLWLMGKGRATPQRLMQLESLSRGDLLASLCATGAGLCAAAGRRADAILQFTDAAELATTRPYFVARLEQYLQHLRNTAVGARTRYLPQLPACPDATVDALPAPAPLAGLLLQRLQSSIA